MTSLKDLVDASKNTYSYQTEAKENGVEGFSLFSTSYDEKSNHSALAYINDNNGEVIVAHRGTDFTKLKDIVTDTQIALNWKETKADIAAVRFTEKVIDDLIDRDFEISKIISTGHSKGGREAQHCLKVLSNTSDYKNQAVTFNSARISLSGTNDKEYDHLNLRLKGTGFLTTDLVTSVGSHLGTTVDIVLPDIKNFIQAHRLTTFDLMDKHYQNAYNNIDISELISNTKSNKDLSIFEAKNADISSSLVEKDLGVNLPVVLQAQIGKSYSGEIVAETNSSYVQRLGPKSNYFTNHSKVDLGTTLKVGDKVEIKYPKDISKKPTINNLNETQVRTRSR